MLDIKALHEWMETYQLVLMMFTGSKLATTAILSLFELFLFCTSLTTLLLDDL